MNARSVNSDTDAGAGGSPSLVRSTSKPLALVVFLENVGHISGLKLPRWLMAAIDFTTEEYAKLLLRLCGAYRRYDRIIVLEDEHANGPELATALLSASIRHRVDLLLLVHGQAGVLVGYQGKRFVGPETFEPLTAAYRRNPGILDLRMVYGLNCHGVSLAAVWLALGAKVANGAVGVNWFPEPSLSAFLRAWLRGEPYSVAVSRSNVLANRLWRRILPRRVPAHPWILSSRQIVYGAQDITIDG